MTTTEALVSAIEEIDMSLNVHQWARFIKRVDLQDGFDELSDAWRNLLAKLRICDEHNILVVLNQKKDIAELKGDDDLR